MAVKQSLSDLESLNREWLHVFLAGPGQGEGLAICLPERGWILVDGCNVRRDLPLLRILERWRDESDPIELMVLTHPHEDHTGGFPDLVERLNPLRIAVTAGNNPRDGLELEAAWWRRQYATGETFLEFRLASSVRNAFRAIDSWSESHPDGLVGLHDGAPVSLDNRSATVAVRAPTASDIHDFFTHPSFLDAFGEHANDLSLVLELVFGHTRLLLGADLPHTRNKTTVLSGWAAVTLRHPHLSDHTYLKVPHHGSREALHPAVLGSERGTGRTWCLTPYNSSRLPRSETAQGLEQLLDLQEVDCRMIVDRPPVSKSCVTRSWRWRPTRSWPRQDPGLPQRSQSFDRRRHRQDNVSFASNLSFVSNLW